MGSPLSPPSSRPRGLPAAFLPRVKFHLNYAEIVDRSGPALSTIRLAPSHDRPARLIFSSSIESVKDLVTSLSVRQRQGRLSSDAVAALNSDLAARFGNRFTASEAIRKAHGHTLTWLENEPPDAVVFAESKEDVIDLVKLCAGHDAPIIPFGVGSSLEGHVNAPHGGVSLDLTRMNNVLAVDADDLDCVVEPGVTRKQLNEHLRDSGLFFPIDPGADASLGGMAATRASGTNAVRYGTMKDVVLSLGVVVADGSFLRTGTRAKKSSAGYDLTHLFIGAEGTLGVIVEVALRLSGIPETIAAGLCSFPSIRAACETTIETIQSGLPIARIELIDTL
ncbi:MAG: FAD-binding protein, partial [Hyphomicrobiales bacterium]|nr:FAD-binding protein [Hyphomicrobiales bacterium]